MPLAFLKGETAVGQYLIEGGHKLEGRVRIQGSKKRGSAYDGSRPAPAGHRDFKALSPD